MNVMRQEVERKIAEAFISEALAAGYALSVNNGGDDDEIKPSSDAATVLAAMFQTDEEHLRVWQGEKPICIGWVFFVYGNSGWDVISDYTVNLEGLMTEANRISDHYAG